MFLVYSPLPPHEPFLIESKIYQSSKLWAWNEYRGRRIGSSTRKEDREKETKRMYLEMVAKRQKSTLLTSEEFIVHFIIVKEMVFHLLQIRLKRRFTFFIHLTFFHETVKLIITL